MQALFFKINFWRGFGHLRDSTHIRLALTENCLLEILKITFRIDSDSLALVMPDSCLCELLLFLRDVKKEFSWSL
jgi:hypothetical protein